LNAVCSAPLAKRAFFNRATFTGDADFSRTTFIESIIFDAGTFAGQAEFRVTNFKHGLSFRRTGFAGIADFAYSTFERPTEVIFHRVNGRENDREFKVRLLSCLVDGFRFEDVRWLRKRHRLDIHGRIMLHDELDFDSGKEGVTHELIGDVYQRLVNNFEQWRQFELAEEWIVGEMEMRRRNPRNFICAG
jgi:hypothetical protein